MRYPCLAAVALLCLGASPALAQLQPLKPIAAPAGDPVVGRVNGAEIRRSEVFEAIDNLPEQYRQMPPAMLFDAVLARIIDGKLLSAAAEKVKLQDDPEVKKKVAAARERVLQDMYLTREVEKGLTDDKLKIAFDKELKANPPAEEVKARHILMDTEAEAKAVIADLAKGGDFAALAKKSKDTSGASNGGDLGYFGKDQMVPEFSTAAFALKKGETSKAPVKSQFGWHVIRVEDRRIAPVPSFEERKEELRGAMGQELVGAMLADLRKGAKIEQLDADGKPKPAEAKK